jgi:hypothetical protein
MTGIDLRILSWIWRCRKQARLWFVLPPEGAMNRLLLAAAVALIGCVHTRVAAVDYETGQVAICGNNHAGPDDLMARAAEVCPTGPKVLRCAENVSGSATFFNAYGAVSAPIRGNCCSYACPALAVSKQ